MPRSASDDPDRPGEYKIAFRIPRHRTSTNPWKPLTNVTLDPGPFILDQILGSTNYFYHGTCGRHEKALTP